MSRRLALRLRALGLLEASEGTGRSLAPHAACPMAEITVAPPVTMSPPAKTPRFCVAPVLGRRRCCPLVDGRSGVVDRISGWRPGRPRTPRVDLDVELRSLDGDGASPPRCVRLAELHPDQADRANVHPIVAEDLGRGDQQRDLHAFLFGVLDLLHAGGISLRERRYMR